MKTHLPLAAAFAAAVLPSASPADPAPAADPATPSVRIAQWKGDAPGAVSLYYDDGTDSSFNNVVPALLARDLPGTFYVCCGWFGGEDDPKLARWAVAKEHPATVFLGDHTWSHGGVTNAAHFAEEIGRNGALLRKLAGLPPDALLSFALPGAVGWKITPEEEAATLAAHHEVLRHDFEPNVAGPVGGNNPTFRMRTVEDAVEAFDRAEKTGSWEALLFHGVGGDWIAYDLGFHDRMLDELKARRDAGRLWVGSEVDVHRYAAARDAAGLKVLKADADGIDFLLPGLDPSAGGVPGPARDASLTVVCAVPAGWENVRVTAPRVARADAISPDGFAVPVKDGRAVFDLPGGCIGVSVRPVR